jgi:malate dehydrogenase
VDGSKATDLVDEAWTLEEFIPTVQQRGAAIIKARGLSSAASAANAAIEHIRDWAIGTSGKIVSMGIHSDGSYGVAKGLIYSFPVVCVGGNYEIVQGLEISEVSQALMDKSEIELKEERDGVASLLP